MRRILEQLDALACYWRMGARGIGHTHAMRVGSDNSDCLVLAHSTGYARELAGRRGITLNGLEQLQGLRRPLVADHFVLGVILANAASAIRELQYELARERAKRG